ncbi:hypothetical protein PG996_004512 [Apiospora saccharicola]|uniref:Uncharacterized protein n=1 Tax=Apiospora saccharicola TaxID=335842 RepID=A0ABR1W4I2_9PEZI
MGTTPVWGSLNHTENYSGVGYSSAQSNDTSQFFMDDHEMTQGFAFPYLDNFSSTANPDSYYIHTDNAMTTEPFMDLSGHLDYPDAQMVDVGIEQQHEFQSRSIELVGNGVPLLEVQDRLEL